MGALVNNSQSTSPEDTEGAEKERQPKKRMSQCPSKQAPT